MCVFGGGGGGVEGVCVCVCERERERGGGWRGLKHLRDIPVYGHIINI